MAAIVKIGARWRAQVRKAGRKSISRTFDTKIEAQRWAMEVESSAGRRGPDGGRPDREISRAAPRIRPPDQRLVE